jgi:hypothetical protein
MLLGGNILQYVAHLMHHSLRYIIYNEQLTVNHLTNNDMKTKESSADDVDNDVYFLFQVCPLTLTKDPHIVLCLCGLSIY